MKIAISSQGTSLEAQVDSQFGRCQYFLIVDSATEAFEILVNEAATASGGAGVQAAQMVVNSGVEAVITGNLGPKATDILQASGIKTYLGVSGTIRQALKQLNEPQFQETSAGGTKVQSVAGGTDRGQPLGLGRGGGGGQGMGRMKGGRGCGRGLGAGPAGECICPSCGTRAVHQAGVPCFNKPCPQCGTPMGGR